MLSSSHVDGGSGASGGSYWCGSRCVARTAQTSLCAQSRYAHRAGIRTDRVRNCVRLIESANQVSGSWSTWMNLLTHPIIKVVEFEKSSINGITTAIESSRLELHGAVSLIRFYGPKELEDAATKVAWFESELADENRKWITPPSNTAENSITPQSGFQLLQQFVNSIQEFATVAKGQLE
jgi:hypothetical protein